jgi:hypothetical protein
MALAIVRHHRSLGTARRVEPGETHRPSEALDQSVGWRPLPNERRSKKRRGTQGFARFVGPGGEAEHTMTESEARAVAEALGVPFEVAPDEKDPHDSDS